MFQKFEEFYNGDPEILKMLEEAIQKKSFVMIYYQPKNKMMKTQNYIILPIRISLVSTRTGLTLMLLAKQPSKQMRIVQFILTEIYTVKFYDPDSSKNAIAGVTDQAVNSVNARKRFSHWGHFFKKGMNGFTD